MLKPNHRTLFLLTVGVVLLAGLTVAVLSRDSTNRQAQATKVLLIAGDEERSGRLGSAINKLEDGGFFVTTNVQQALDIGLSDGAVSFLATRSSYGQVSASAWQSMYHDNVVVGGLDIASPEISPLARYGSAGVHLAGNSASSAQLSYTTERPIFTVLFSTCSTGAMSDWLHSWENLLASMIEDWARMTNDAGVPDCSHVRPADR